MPTAIERRPVSPQARDARPSQAALRRFGGRTDPLRFERRSEARDRADGFVMATYSGPGRVGVTRLELVDRSASGLGVVSRVRIEPGMTVTVCADGSANPWLSGRAVRCEPIEGEVEKWRIGLVLAHRRAA